MGVVELTKDNFEETINDRDFVIVDFWAPWCVCTLPFVRPRVRYGLGRPRGYPVR